MTFGDRRLLAQARLPLFVVVIVRPGPLELRSSERPLSDEKGFQSASDGLAVNHHPLGLGNLLIWRKVRGRARLHAVQASFFVRRSSGPWYDCSFASWTCYSTAFDSGRSV